MDGFMLRKSYLDVVDTAGRCAMAYWTELRWGPLAVRWEELSVRDPGRPAVHRGAFGESGPPSRLAWNSGALGFRASCEPWCAPFEKRLLETARGTLDWSCEAPGADVVVECAEGTALRGAGYREDLVLTLPPWELPIEELRWGRWLSPERRQSIVWIDWRAASPLTVVLSNGAVQDDGGVGDAAVRCGGGKLSLARSETIYSRTLVEILRGAGGLASRLPAAWRALEDRKMLCSCALGPDPGWAIHEMVRFP